ncbi:hypothetical protein CBR_g50312 [Chara braunii]|uniref:Uncharacterized protein n=1 Tax=Chara braunii TaxID=69332 RepID=A0A388K5D7_CHABU|nr:hypothetical protein CBR_g50312 [Chara braunii]|eukprot:GBG65270.1 hypothetical protein CBR_g50312 [Chara braunii]
MEDVLLNFVPGLLEMLIVKAKQCWDDARDFKGEWASIHSELSMLKPLATSVSEEDLEALSMEDTAAINEANQKLKSLYEEALQGMAGFQKNTWFANATKNMRAIREIQRKVHSFVGAAVPLMNLMLHKAYGKAIRSDMVTLQIKLLAAVEGLKKNLCSKGPQASQLFAELQCSALAEVDAAKWLDRRVPVRVFGDWEIQTVPQEEWKSKRSDGQSHPFIGKGEEMGYKVLQQFKNEDRYQSLSVVDGAHSCTVMVCFEERFPHWEASMRWAVEKDLAWMTELEQSGWSKYGWKASATHTKQGWHIPIGWYTYEIKDDNNSKGCTG